MTLKLPQGPDQAVDHKFHHIPRLILTGSMAKIAIHWGAISVSMIETKRKRRVFTSKHVSGMCGVGKFMKR
jgi:hypothetical protein